MSNLESSALERFRNQLKAVSFEPGQTIIAPGHLPAGLYWIKSGKVRLLGIADSERAPLTLAILPPGDDFGGISLLLGKPLETAIASTRVECALFPASDFLSAADSFSESILNRVSPAELFTLLKSEVPAAKARELFPKAEVSRNGNLSDSYRWWPASRENFGGTGVAGRMIGIPTCLLVAPAGPPPPEEPRSSDLTPGDPYLPPKGLTGAGLPAVEACLETACRISGLEFPGEIVRRLLAGSSPTLRKAAAAARLAGLEPTILSVAPAEFSRVQPPALLLRDGRPELIVEATATELKILDPQTGVRTAAVAEFLPAEAVPIEILLLKSNTREASDKFSLKWFLPAIREHKRVLIEVFVASLFVQLFALANPLITQVVIDKVLVQNSPQSLNVFGALLIVIAGAGAILGAVRTFLFTDVTNRIDLKLGSRIVDHLYRLTLGYFQRRPVGEVSSRLNELESIRTFLTGTALTIVLDALFSVIYIAVMLFYSIPLSIVALLALPLLAGIAAGVTPLYRRQLRSRAEKYSLTQSHLVESLTGVQTLKAQGMEQRSLWEWQKRYAAFVAEGFRATLTSTTTGAVTGFLSKLSDVAVLWYGAWLVIDGKLTLGQLIAFRIIAGYVTNPLLRLVQSWQNFQEVGMSVERLGDVLDSPIEQSESEKGRIPLPPIQGSVRFEEVTFQYTAGFRPQLRNVSFEIPAGSMVGVAGLSGSGKSTLMKLIPRLLVPTHGRVMIDGYDVSKVELYSLRNQIATVLQDTLLFNESIRDNIALSNPDATSEEIVAAARAACAHNFIMELPEGYNTRAGEQGRALSGGQRQRIALARAILQKPRLMILDEATSALDYPTEREVSQRLREAVPGVTLFFVTHRLPSIQQADLILVMENGVLIEHGNHAVLMALNGFYANLHRKQELSF